MIAITSLFSTQYARGMKMLNNVTSWKLEVYNRLVAN
jgi:hypothetical protein